MVSIIFSFLLFQSVQNQNLIWSGRSSIYTAYCKERSGFYSIEIRGIKYYRIENLIITGRSDTVAKSENIFLIVKKNNIMILDMKLDLNHVKIKLRQTKETSEILDARKRLFVDWIGVQSSIKGINRSAPVNTTLTDYLSDSFNEYDKTGNIANVIQKYLTN